MNNNLELSNINKLDESISNAIGMTDNMEYSNLINESLLNGLTENTSLLNADGETFSYASAGKDLASLSGCKKPKSPLLGIFTGGLSNINYKKKKKAYEECINNYKQKLESQAREASASKQRAADAEAKLNAVKKELEDVKSSPESTKRMSADEDGKILGMPKAVAIGLGVVVVAVGGFFLYKAIKGNK